MSTRAQRKVAREATELIDSTEGDPLDPTPVTFRATPGELEAYRMVSDSFGLIRSRFIRDAIREKTRRMHGKS